METVLGTYRDGQVILEHKVDWPNGAKLEVRFGNALSHHDREDCCVDGSRPPSTPAEIDEWMKWFDTVEPFDWSEAERSRFEQVLRESDEVSKADMRKQWHEEGVTS